MKLWPTMRSWKRLAIGLAVLVGLALILNGVFAWRAEWRLNSRLAAIRAAGEPASIAELAPKPIPDRENAAAILQRIKPRLNDFSNEYGAFFNSTAGKKYEAAQDRGEPATPEQIDAIRAILNKYSDVEQALADAAKQEHYASRMDFSLDHKAFLDALLKNTAPARTAARLLNWRIEVLLAEGHRAQAVERGIQVLRLARLHEAEPCLISFLVAVAMEGTVTHELYDVLAAGPISPELHSQLDAELAQRDDPLRLVRALTLERAMSADWVYGHVSGWYGSLAHVIGWPLKSFQVGVLDLMQEYIELADQPWHAVRGEFGTGNTQPPRTGHGVMADLLVPAVKAAFEANARRTAVSRALRIYNAQRAFAEKNGRAATGLHELGLPQQATIDPYSGQPLKLEHADDGSIVYSVMTNGVDDGGDFKGLKDYGVAPPKLRLTE
jgi:hypothetical protein